MNHTPLKKFAAKARVDLIEQVGARLRYVLNSDSVELREKSSQVKQLREALKLESETALVERVAYLWFNRLAALRFMDAEGRHPFGCRVVTATPGNTQPELLQQARNGTFPEGLKLDVDRVNDLLDGKVPSSNAQAEVYRMLVAAVCNFYHQLMPFVFEKIADYSELLLPEDLLSEASVADGFRAAITDKDCVDVEVLGWLYQYYISEKKDAVMARKKAVPKEDIPAVTQLFTPHWIVRYMVENSLGRLWMQSRPSSRLTEKMPYYIADDANADAIDVGELDVSTGSDALTVKSPEEIKLIDPACGSGHILTYAFDLLYAIYEEEGYEPSVIPNLILSNNLHGVEIDERAAELAYFALMMKAQQHYGRFLRRQLRAESKDRTVPQICCLEEVHFEEGELKTYMDELKIGGLFNHDVLTLMHQFEDAKNLGSLIQPILPDVAFLRGAIRERDLRHDLFLFETHRKVLTVLRQAEFLEPRYHCAVANPPYMGGGAMNSRLKTYASERYKNSKADMFTMFIERNNALVLESGFNSMITMQSWMFLSSYEKLREKLLDECFLASMIHLGPRAFDTIGGEVVQATAFTLMNYPGGNQTGAFLRLLEGNSEREKSDHYLQAVDNPACGRSFRASAADFKKIPGSLVAYWLSNSMKNVFTISALSNYAVTREGMVTGNNDMFIRDWYEVSRETCAPLKIKNQKTKNYKWYGYIKGGPARKWYGNLENVVDWGNNGKNIRTTIDPERGKVRGSKFNLDYIFKPCISWSSVGGESFSARYSFGGALFDSTGPSCFPAELSSMQVIAFLNSKPATSLLSVINSTIRRLPGDIGKLPFKNNIVGFCSEIIDECIALAHNDWDNFETSWDFKDLPLLRDEFKNDSLYATWKNWDKQCKANITRMQELETENNRLWIDAYDLQDELTPEVPEQEITLARADPKKDMAAFLSYTVGCMFGRYSLNKTGLILANAGETIADYLQEVKSESDAENVTFMPDDDNIIPILDAEWFEDDIVARFREFLKVTFGEATLTENIQFIEDSLGKELRKYFATDFYKDHLKTYKKRPIYWLFQSPKKSFQALIYLHRYDRDTVNLLLNDYLREFQNKLQNRRKHLDEILASESTSARDKTAATKEQNKIAKTLPELADWEREVILPLAQKRLEIDLDDGVKVNYPKFGKALAKIAGVS